MSFTDSISAIGEAHLYDAIEAIQWLAVTPNTDIIRQIVGTLITVRENQGTVYVAGNGGSAANALHLAGHLGDVGINAVCHVANPVALTAAANDHGYEDSLSRQIQWAGTNAKHNAAIAISCSGQSANIQRWLTSVWKLTGNLTELSERHIGLFGEATTDKAHCSNLCGISLHVDSPDPAVVEDVHSAVIHAITKMLRPVEGIEVTEDVYRLCYIGQSDRVAYFTPKPVSGHAIMARDRQAGDSWAMVPYEHNAGIPYDLEDCKMVWWAAPGLQTPADIQAPASTWSVEAINNSGTPWLEAPDIKNRIWAGATIDEFIGKVEAAGGVARVEGEPIPDRGTA